ncbi:MAG: hypothetical protein C0593_13505 [Marinilabiliales bacterium]|nr:MAG: hypothetical protein C0593_13505 [Marinilabiliales bacterium]
MCTMRKCLFLVLLIIISIFSACTKEDVETPVSPSLSNFTFLKTNNPGLLNNVYTYIDGDKFYGSIPYDADISNLIASFDFVGSEVRIGSQIQNSGSTVNDFHEPVTYTVVGQNGMTKDYSIDIVRFTGLPVINIYTENGVEITSKDEYVAGFISIEDGNGLDSTSGNIYIRGRGHSTWYMHPKKPYQLKFENKTEVVGMPEDKKWIFLAEYSDKTLIRNRLAFEMGYISNLEWTPECKYGEVYINDDYRGTYNITQKVEESDNRVNIGSDGFLCEIDNSDHIEEGDIVFYSTRFTIQVKEPEITVESPEYEYIKNHIISFEDVLYSDNFMDPVNGYSKYIDVASFVDWYLINEIAKNVDSKDYSSMYFSLVPSEKIKMGPLWDFDLGFGNVDYADSQYPEGFWVMDHQWFSRLFEDPAFVEKVKTRFLFFRNNQDYFTQIIDDQADYLRWAQQENDNRWDLFGNYVWPNPVVYNTHIQEVNYLKYWFNERMKWLENAYMWM